MTGPLVRSRDWRWTCYRGSGQQPIGTAVWVALWGSILMITVMITSWFVG